VEKTTCTKTRARDCGIIIIHKTYVLLSCKFFRPFRAVIVTQMPSRLLNDKLRYINNLYEHPNIILLGRLISVY